MSDNESQPNSSRRKFLKTAGASGAVTGLTGVGSAQEQDQSPEVIRLFGRIDSWLGRSPEAIAGKSNPVLDLEPGKDYKVVWTNVDGAPHNFVIINNEGDELVRSEVISKKGATQTVEFTAKDSMAVYFCEVHPAAMRGRVKTGLDRPEQKPQERQIPVDGKVGLQTVATDITAPLSFETMAGKRFVGDQTGQIWVLNDDGGIREDPFLNIEERMVELGVERLRGYDERGLLGFAFHPNFQENRRLYVRYSAPRGENPPEAIDVPEEVNHTEVLSEFKANENELKVDPGTEKEVLRIPSPQMNHDGGAVAFGPDGLLYTSLGDGGAADDVGPGHVPDWYEVNEGGNGQDIQDNLWGSILRLDVDPKEDQQQVKTLFDKKVGVPKANPKADELEFPLNLQYAWGFRNPWRMSFNKGQLWAADVGQNLYEEVDIVKKGGNYGWNVKEGTHCFSTDHPTEPRDKCPDETPDGEPLLDPVAQFRHRKSTTAFIDGSAIIGGYVYENDTVQALQDTYVFGNWSGDGVVAPEGEILVASPPGDIGMETSIQRVLDDEQFAHDLWAVKKLEIAGAEDAKLHRYVLGMGKDDNGEIYVLTSAEFTPTGDTGAVHKIVPPGQGETLAPPEEERGPQQQPGGNQTAGNETAGNETVGNETVGNETAGNETAGNETAGNETAGNETSSN